MTNPALVPMLILTGGIVWNIVCGMVAIQISKGQQFSTTSSFWIRQAGWMGFALSLIAAVTVFLLN